MANTETKSARGTAANATNKTAEAVKATARNAGDATFGKATFDVPEVVRSFAEQGLNQSREAYGRMKVASEEATDMMEETIESTRESMRDVQFRALDAAQANAEATFELARKLMTVSSVAEALQLQSTFARERFEAFVDYSKEMQSTFSKVGAEASKPAKVMFDRAMSQTKN